MLFTVCVVINTRLQCKAFVHFLFGLHFISFAKKYDVFELSIIINMLFDLCSMLKIKEFTSQTKL